MGPPRDASRPNGAARLVELYRAYGAVVYARCRQILSDETAAEDATQETFLRAKRFLDRAGDPERALPWLYTIATNYCLNELRNSRNRPLISRSLPERMGTDLQQLLADRDLAKRLVERALPKVRSVAWLCHVDGMGQDEAAQLLGVSRRTVAARLARFTRDARRFWERTQP